VDSPPPMLTVENIVSDMCEGQFADRHKNDATKSRLPPQLWFVDNVLQKNVYPLGTQNIETGPIPHSPVFILQRPLVLHSRDHLDAVA
jgi:hypothetical protein